MPQARKSSQPRGGLLAVEEDEPQLGRAGRPADALHRARDLDDRRGAARAVVGADEPLGLVLRVVMGRHHDGGQAARDPPDDVAQARMAGDRLEPSAGQRAPQPLGEPAQGGRPGGTRAELLDLLAQQREGAAAVEAVDPRPRHERGGGRRGGRRSLARARRRVVVAAEPIEVRGGHPHEEPADRQLREQRHDEHLRGPACRVR
jgi:hypothetical protein